VVPSVTDGAETMLAAKPAPTKTLSNDEIVAAAKANPGKLITSVRPRKR
jgi:hypothetical protein